MKDMIFTIEVISSKVQGLGSCDLTMEHTVIKEIANIFNSITEIEAMSVEYFGESYDSELFIDFETSSLEDATKAFYKLLAICSADTQLTLIHRNPPKCSTAKTIVSEFGSLGCFYLI